MITTGRRLKRIRQLHGVTSTAGLAALCRVDVSTLWRWTVAGEVPRGNNEARLAELEAHSPAKGTGDASSGQATAEADSSAPPVAPSTDSQGAS